MLGNFPISVSYDRTGNILIGMDILRNLNIFIGNNTIGETILLARKNETQTFVAELSKLINVKRV